MRPFCCLTVAYNRSRSARFDTSPETTVTFFSDLLHCCVEFALRAAGNENVRALRNETFAVVRPILLLSPVMTTIFSASFSMIFS
jgi:hypothetical protein